MNLVSKVSPDAGTLAGLMGAAGVYLIYNNALPTVADIRSTSPHNADAESARKAAAWKSTALIGVVFLVARNFDSFIVSGAALIGIDFMYKHANAVHPATGKIDASSDGTSIAPGLATAFPMESYYDDSSDSQVA